MVPKTQKEATRFELTSVPPLAGEVETGDVFTYDSREDLEVMKSYWESLNEQGGMFFSWVYEKDNALVHLPSRLPKTEAERFGEVLEEM